MAIDRRGAAAGAGEVELSEQSRPTDRSDPPTLAVVGACERKIWGLDAVERLKRSFRRAGVSAVVEDGARLPDHGSVVLARAEYVVEESLVKAQVAQPGVILTMPGKTPGGQVAIMAHVAADQAAAARDLLRRDEIAADQPPPDGLRLVGPATLGSEYNEALVKRALPYALSLIDEPIGRIEKRTFDASYKGATDFVTKWCWPIPARWATKWAAERSISPNTVTTVSLVFVLLAIYLFAEGNFLLGIAAAWLMTFLDTVDGKLARVTLTSSKWGNVYDHGIDLIHPPFWWAAWWYGLRGGVAPEMVAPLDAALWIIIVGYLAGRLMEGIFLFGFGIQTHIWRPIDSFFRRITARRNPNLALLMVGALAGRPDLGFLAVAVWTIVSLSFHAVRLVQAALFRRRGGEIKSWLLEPS